MYRNKVGILMDAMQRRGKGSDVSVDLESTRGNGF